MSITDPLAYERAVKRNILENAHKTWSRTHEDWLEIENYLDWAYSTVGNDAFSWKMADSLNQYGKLTEKQTQAVRDSMARSATRRVERAEKRAAQIEADKAASNWVGEEKQRMMFTDLECVYTTEWDGDYGRTYIYICTDTDKNKIVLKVTKDLEIEKGYVFSVKATVAAHEERDGVKQTRINRPAEVTIK